MWAEIPGFSAYRVNNAGDVWSDKRKRLLVPHVVLRRAHATVTVMPKNDDGKWVTRKVGHLVLEAFVSKRPVGAVMRHLDGDGTNNRLENLCWGTQADNVADAQRHGTACGASGSANSHAVLTETEVLEIRELVWLGAKRKDVAKAYGVSYSAVCFIQQRRTWDHI